MLDEQVIISPLESWVLFNLQDENNVSCHCVRLQHDGRHIAILIVANAVINNSMDVYTPASYGYRKGGELSSQLDQLHPGTQSFGHAAFLSQYEPQEPSSPEQLCWLCSLGTYPFHL